MMVVSIISIPRADHGLRWWLTLVPTILEEIFALFSRGSTVLIPSPWNPPVIPTMSIGALATSCDGDKMETSQNWQNRVSIPCKYITC